MLRPWPARKRRIWGSVWDEHRGLESAVVESKKLPGTFL
jgi:hypothetical protein